MLRAIVSLLLLSGSSLTPNSEPKKKRKPKALKESDEHKPKLMLKDISKEELAEEYAKRRSKAEIVEVAKKELSEAFAQKMGIGDFKEAPSRELLDEAYERLKKKSLRMREEEAGAVHLKDVAENGPYPTCLLPPQTNGPVLKFLGISNKPFRYKCHPRQGHHYWFHTTNHRLNQYPQTEAIYERQSDGTYLLAFLRDDK